MLLYSCKIKNKGEKKMEITNEHKRVMEFILSLPRHDIYGLCGNHNKDGRQRIYSILTGRKTTKAESGIANIRNFMIQLLEVDTKQCERNIDLDMIQKMKELTK